MKMKMSETVDSIQKYKYLFENNPDGVCEIDLQGRFVEVNKAFVAITGRSKAELFEMNVFELIFPDDVESVKRRSNQRSSGAFFIPAAIRVKHKNSRCIHVLYTRVPITRYSEVLGFYVIIKDITEQKNENERSIRKNQSMLTHLQRIARVGSWEFDPIQQRSLWSSELFHIYGLDGEGYVSLDEMVKYIHPEDKKRFLQSVKALSSGQPYDIEFRIVLSDGEVKVLHSKREMCVSNGETRLIGTVQDITELKRTQELLLKSEKLSAIGQLAAGVAHEIRNPLTALKGFLKLIPKTDDPGRYIEIMENELCRIESVTNELLMLAKPQMKQYKSVDIGQKLTNVLSLLTTQALMKSIEVCVEGFREAVYVECDSGQIEQVFINLIKNAIEAAPECGKVSVQLRKSDSKNIMVRVIDNGQGVPQEVIDKLGEPFLTTKENGTGLGLMISQKIIMEHHGELEIESKVGEGTAMSIILPVQQPKD